MLEFLKEKGFREETLKLLDLVNLHRLALEYEWK